MRAFEEYDRSCRHRRSEKCEQVTTSNPLLAIWALAELKRLSIAGAARQTQQFSRLEGPRYLWLAGCQPELSCSAAQAGRKILARSCVKVIAKVVRNDNCIICLSCSRGLGCS